MKIMRRCPVCRLRWDKSQMMCPDHPGVLGIVVVNYDDDLDIWYQL